MDAFESKAPSSTMDKIMVVVGFAIVGMLSNSLQTAFFIIETGVLAGMSATVFSMLCTTLTGIWMLLASWLISVRPLRARLVPWLFIVPTGAGIALIACSILLQSLIAVPATIVLTCGIAFGFLFWIGLTARFALEEALIVLIAFRALSSFGALAIKGAGFAHLWLVVIAMLYALAVVLTYSAYRSGATASFGQTTASADLKLGSLFKKLWEPILFVSILGFASGTMRAFFQPDQAFSSSLIVAFSGLAGIAMFYVVYRKTKDQSGVLGVRLAALLAITAVYAIVPFIAHKYWIVCSGLVDMCYVAATISMYMLCVRESGGEPARAVVATGLFRGIVFLSIALGFTANSLLGEIVPEDSTASLILSLMGVYVVLLATVFVVVRRLKAELATKSAPTVFVNLSENQVRCNAPLQKTYGITEREMDVLLLAVAGASVSSIGKQLYISENTVKTYLKRIYTKLDVHSRDELREFVADLVE